MISKLIYVLILLILPGLDQDTGKLTGQASYYADKFEGLPTASGELYRAAEYTAAHRSLPFGTRIRVTNKRNNKTVIVRVNDRGPNVKRRIIDVSRAAAVELDFIREGVTVVSLEVLTDDEKE